MQYEYAIQNVINNTKCDIYNMICNMICTIICNNICNTVCNAKCKRKCNMHMQSAKDHTATRNPPLKHDRQIIVSRGHSIQINNE